MARYSDEYNPNSTVAPSSGMPNDYLNVRANPNQFGAQEGEGLQKAGAELQQVGNQGIDLALQHQGMINETLSTDADTALAAAHGTILGQYKSLQGLAAVHALPDTVTALQQTRQKIRSTLPNPAAQRAFDLFSARREAFALSDINNYSATQVKAADRNSAQSAANVSIDAASDPSVAASDAQFNYNLGDVKFQVGRIVNNLGYMEGAKQDSKTGDVTFPDTDEGREAKAVYEDQLNQYTSKAWTNRISTLMNDPNTGSVERAVDVLTRNKDRIPSATYASLSAKLAPAYRNEQARQGADEQMGDIRSRYQSHIQTSISDNGTLEGNKTVLSGLLPGVTFTSGQRTPEHNAEVGGVPNSQHIPGQALDFVLPKGMTFDQVKTNLQLGRFKATELINEGDHIHVAWGNKSGTPVSQAAQGYISQADYINLNYSKFVDEAREKAQKLHPGDSTFEDTYVSRAEQGMRQIIDQQNRESAANKDYVTNIIKGDNKSEPIVNIDQLYASTDPKVKEAVTDWLKEDPYAEVKLNNLVNANTHGQATGYGTQFYDLYSKVAAGQIHDQTDLLHYLGGKANAPLTNTGYYQLKQMLQDQQTPEGSAWSHEQQKFLDGVKNAMTSPLPGMKLPELDSNFQKSLVTILPRIQAGRSAGKTTGELFNPDSPDYVGKDVKYPTKAEITAAATQHVLNGMRQPDTANKSYNSYDDLKKDFAGKKGGRTAAEAYLNAHDLWGKPGWPARPAPAVPTSFGN